MTYVECATGERDGTDWCVASESVVLDSLNYKIDGDVGPGEAVLILKDGSCQRRQVAEPALHTPCIFEYVYFARPDSIIDGRS